MAGTFDRAFLGHETDAATVIGKVQGEGGGRRPASDLGAACAGWISQEPDHVIHAQSPFERLRASIMARSTGKGREVIGSGVTDSSDADIQRLPELYERRRTVPSSNNQPYADCTPKTFA